VNQGAVRLAEQTDSLLRDCLRIRLVEEKIIELYPSDLIQSPVHLSIGQESVAVGVVGALTPGDLVFPNYRGHAFYLAKGGPMELFFAELMGRQTGISKGKAGSMHLSAPEQGLMGASAVVASTISHAVGAALAERIKPDGNPERVFVSVFGDGATEQGGFFESLNFASIHKLPVLFLCEDNGLAVHTNLQDRQSYTLERIAHAFSVGYARLEEGYDPSSVHKSASQCVEQIRKGSGPIILHIKTMRYMEHVGPGEDFFTGYREESEVDEWKALDPIFEYEASSPMVVQAIRNEIEKAVIFATESPFPTIEELLTDVL
jgi:TPP-dependent pyruvate/acetoin dehydrogenase alpha subunit